MAILGLATGVVTSLVILCFRLLIDSSLGQIIGDDPDQFELLSIASRVGLIMTGALVLGALLNRYRPSARRTGVVHVMERLSRHQGYLPLKNAVIQFLGGAIALISGQSGGREGPAIHLGATTASLLGQAAKLPNNSIRTLVACGTAAAIASSFNTPIAGVIFAMEVVMMEYAIASFIPVIVAAVASTLVTQYFFGAEPAFNMLPLHMHSVLEIPYLILGGVLIGCLAAGYIQLIQAFARLSSRLAHRPFWLRIALAGALTAAFATVLPQVMGVGYDTVNQIMLAEISITLLIAIFVGKAITSAAAVGLGMPIGLIGPSLLLGATVGGIFGNALVYWQGADISVGFYVMLGMCAMMGAVLQAPLAALMAVMEMTANTNLILPAMVIIVVATMVTSQVFRQRSVFITTLNTLGLQYPPSPVTLHLQRIGATAIMDRSFVRLPEYIDHQRAIEVLAEKTNWILIDDTQGKVCAALNPADLAAFIEADKDTAEEAGGMNGENISLLQLPGQRMDVTSISSQATALQVQQALSKSQTEACCITRITAPMIAPVLGIVTQHHIDNYRNVTE